MELFREIYPAAFHAKFLEHNLRADGRGQGEVRPLAAVAGNLSSTLGSSFVKLGRTTVTVGVKGELGPVADAGVEVHVELSSICNGERPGLPSAFALFLRDALEQALCGKGREAVAPAQLVVDGARDVAWVLTADAYCVDDDGAVLDAMVAAAVVALESTVLPPLAWNKETGRFEQTEGAGKRLALSNRPFAQSFALIDKWIVTDPSHEEEEVAGALVSVVCDRDGRLAAVEKRGGTALSRAQLAECVEAALKNRPA